MAEYSCNSAECDGRIFDSREGTARCIYCGSEDIRRLVWPRVNPLLIILAGLLVVFLFFCFNVRWSGCKNERACNYDSTVLFNDSEDCTFGTMLRDCDGNCLRDIDADGVCDSNEVFGCTDTSACNFNEEATEAGVGSCFYADPGYNCAGGCLNDKDRDGICDSDEVYGCRDREAYNFNDFATKDDGSCRYFSSDRKHNDENKVVFGCTDREAYNFNDFATKDDGSCQYFSLVKDDKCENKLYHGVIYQVVEVNGECWFAENLRTRKFNDGSSLRLYDKSNSTAQTKATEMGLTYNYRAVSTSRLCPVGWSVPLLEDWNRILKGERSEDVLNQLNLHPFYTFDVYGNEKRRLEYWLPYPIDFRNAESIFIYRSESQVKGRTERRNKSEMLGIRCKTD